FKSAIALSPNYANAHHWYAELLLNLGRFDESLQESYKAKRLDPLSPVVITSLGSRLVNIGRTEEGIREIKSALELDPNLPLAHMDLGEAYVRQQKYNDALVEFKKATQFANNNPNAIANLGFVYGLIGDREGAVESLRKLNNSSAGYTPFFQIAVV